jgi:hypothetical protein
MLKYNLNGVRIDRNMVWGSIHGEKTRIKDMDDEYLINLWHYHDLVANLNNRFSTGSICIRSVIAEVLEERGLDIKDYPTTLPYENEGVWMLDGIEATEAQVLAYKLKLPIPKREKEAEFEEMA